MQRANGPVAHSPHVHPTTPGSRVGWLTIGPMAGWLLLLALAAGCLAADSTATIRGKLAERGGKPALELASGKVVHLEGDPPTTGVIRDRRLRGFDFEARGRFLAPDRFLIDPIHTGAMLVYRDGKPKRITYWCATCSIRTYTPGTCWCCQQETGLDLRDPETESAPGVIESGR